jgi:hypothetical protein
VRSSGSAARAPPMSSSATLERSRKTFLSTNQRF